jgi:hypothetical protein
MRALYFQSILAIIVFRILDGLIYKTDIVTLILCGSGVWCLILIEDNTLIVYGSRAVSRIFDVIVR